MRRRLCLLLLSASLAPTADASVGVGESGLSFNPEHSYRQFQRNYDLVHAFVLGGLRLSSAHDEVQRADACNTLAEQLAAALQKAVVGQDGERAIELAHLLQPLLEQGVAGNLAKAHKRLPRNSQIDKTFRDVRDQATMLLAPVQEQIRQSPSREAMPLDALQEVLQSLTHCREELAKIPPDDEHP